MKRHSIYLACLGLVFVSCTGNFEKYNTNPHEAHDVNISGFITSMQMDVIPTSDVGANEYQRACNLTGDIFGGYLSATHDWNNSSNNTTYNLWFDNWNDVGFTVAFTKVMSPWLRLKRGLEQGNLSPEAFAVAEILKVAAMHRVTDNYGPLPYLGFGESKQVAYNSQKDIYDSFFADLDAAIGVLREWVATNPSARPLRKVDLVYGGDYAGWLKFAGSLKLRLAMRTVYVDPTGAKRRAEEAVATGVMTVNDDNALLKSGLGVQVFNPLEMVWNDYADTRMNASMDSYMNGYGDPRRAFYFRQATSVDAADTNDGFHGVRGGVTIRGNAVRGRLNAMSAPNVAKATPVVWMTAAEVWLLRAEGAARGWDMGATAGELYETGVARSFEYCGMGDRAADYLADGERTPEGFTDVSGAGLGSIAAASGITIPWDDNAPDDEKLERIITQKWIAMFPLGQEAWSEFRRTGYPRLFPVVTNNSGSTVDTDTQIRRVNFPQSEYVNNAGQMSDAVKLLDGLDNGGTRLWWDKK